MFNNFIPLILLLNEMSPYLLLGFLFAGFLKAFIPKDKYIGLISKPNFRSVLLATFAGIPLPLCSCGVIPTGISLHKEGASNGATVSFLTSTPQTNIHNTIATYSLLGLPFAVMRVVGAIISSLTGGIISNKIEKTAIVNETEKKCEKIEHKPKNKIYQALHYGLVEMQQDIGKWLLIGILIAGFIAVFLPDEIFSVYLNNPILNMLIVLLIALPTYTCATGSIPMAAVLMMKGLSPGAAFVFLMAGPVTSIASMTVIGKSMGKRILIIYIANIIINTLLFGLFIDYIIPSSWFDMSSLNHSLCCATGFEHISIFKSICSAALIGFIVNAYIQKFKNKSKKEEPCCCEHKN